MADKNSEGLESTGPENETLEDQIDHWMEVLDRWVKRIDAGLREENGDPSGPDGEERG
ncbi:MAG TPA: hypothetical protein VIP57_05265 [Candidatus Dormibacteraeota bacterium]|jgi:hypothetical protein